MTSQSKLKIDAISSVDGWLSIHIKALEQGTDLK